MRSGAGVESIDVVKSTLAATRSWPLITWLISLTNKPGAAPLLLPSGMASVSKRQAGAQKAVRGMVSSSIVLLGERRDEIDDGGEDASGCKEVETLVKARYWELPDGGLSRNHATTTVDEVWLGPTCRHRWRSSTARLANVFVNPTCYPINGLVVAYCSHWDFRSSGWSDDLSRKNCRRVR